MGPPAAPPPAPSAPPKPALTEEEVERKSKAIIEEYLHINEMKVRRGRCCSPLASHRTGVLKGPILVPGDISLDVWAVKELKVL